MGSFGTGGPDRGRSEGYKTLVLILILIPIPSTVLASYKNDTNMHTKLIVQILASTTTYILLMIV